MTEPKLLPPIAVTDDTWVLPGWMPLPGLGLLPINAFVIRAREPVLVDTGAAAWTDDFMARLRELVDPEALRWIWLTHTDADHTGSLSRVLAAAPNARVVTTYLGMGKLSLTGAVPPERLYLLNPGQTLDAGDRGLVARRPPTFDAPETTGLYDTKTRALFPADSFGALLAAPADDAAQVSPASLREGLITWSTVDAPWLHHSDEALMRGALSRVCDLRPSVVLSSHLPPARGLTETLASHLLAARTATPFEGPDQAALERMLKAA